MPTAIELKSALTEAQKEAAAAAKAASDAKTAKDKKATQAALTEAQKKVDDLKAAHKSAAAAEKKAADAAAKAATAPAAKPEVISKETAAAMAADTTPSDGRIVVDFAGTGKEAQSLAVTKGTRVQDALKEIGWSVSNVKLTSKNDAGALREISLSDPITASMKITIQAKSAGG